MFFLLLCAGKSFAAGKKLTAYSTLQKNLYKHFANFAEPLRFFLELLSFLGHECFQNVQRKSLPYMHLP